MTREEQNKEIATILGFTVFDPGKNSGSPVQWSYPQKYVGLQYGIPAITIPDFVSLIDQMILLITKNPVVYHDHKTKLEHKEC